MIAYTAIITSQIPISDVRETNAPRRRARGTAAGAGGAGMVSMLDKASISCSLLGEGAVDRGEDRALVDGRGQRLVQASIAEDEDAIAQEAEVGDLGRGDEHGGARLGDAVQRAEEVLTRLDIDR